MSDAMSRRIFAVLAAALVIASGCSRCQPEAPPSPEGAARVHFVGRFDFSDPAGPRFAWPGSAIEARFEGSRVLLSMLDHAIPEKSNNYTVVLDKGAPKKIIANSSKREYLLAEGLGPGPHEITVFRNTEAFIGESQFLGFDFGPGGALLPRAPKARRIEIIGDSISVGYGNEGKDKSCPFTPETENNYLAYGSIAARELDAEVTTIAWSGKGVSRNYDGVAGPLLPELYRLTLPERAESAWKFDAPPPRAVVINLGSNDFSRKAPEKSRFVGAYGKHVSFVREKYPNAHIFCAIGPMLSDEWPKEERLLSTARAYISSVVEAKRGAGDKRIHLIEFPTQNEERDGLGCDYHPSLATHRAMAARLASAIRAELGW